MTDLNKVSTIVCTVRNNEQKIFNENYAQIVGDPSLRAQMTFNYPISLTEGTFYIRPAKSNYNGTDGKQEIIGGGGFPTEVRVDELDGVGIVSANSAALTEGTSYVGLAYWVSDSYSGNHWEGDASAGEVWPDANDLIVTNEITIAQQTTAATDISISGSVEENSPAGTPIATASANRTDGTWSIVSQDGSTATINAQSGAITAATTVGSAGTYNLTLRYDNSAISGGGTFDKAVSFTITEATSGTERYIPVPTLNSDASGRNLSLGAAESLIASMDGGSSNWAAGCTTLGIATSGVDAVIQLASGSLGDLSWSNIGPFTDGSETRYIHIRGQGTFSRNSYQPTGGTNLGSISLTNCEGIRFWQIAATKAGVNTAFTLDTCDDVQFNRCHLAGSVATSTSALATTPTTRFLVRLAGASTGLKFRQCTLMGAEDAIFIYSDGAVVADGVEISGCMVDQLKEDIFKIGNDSHAKDWVITDMLGPGVCRNPGSAHGDWLQCQGTGIATGWNINGVGCFWDQFYGARTGIAIGMKIFQKAPNAVMNTFTVRNFLYGGGANFATGGPASSSYRYCDYLPPADTVAADNQDTSPWQAKFGGFGGISNLDYCVAISNNSSGDAADTANGLVDYDPGYVAADNGAYDFSGYSALLARYSAPSGDPATTAPTSAIPRRSYGISGWAPKVGSGMHWDDADPAGAFQFKELLYDTVTHDNPWDWGWPTCALMAIRFDPEGNCGGGGANSNGTSFNSDGD